MRKITVGLIMVLNLILISSCSFTGAEVSSPGTGDVIVMPEPSGKSALNVSQRNIVSNNAYQQNVINKLYDTIGNDQKFIDFSVDERNIFILQSRQEPGTKVESGNQIDVYDIETSSLSLKIVLNDHMRCNAISVKNKIIYLYDYVSGNILKYSTDGIYKGEIDAKAPNLTIDKMEVLASGRQIIILGTSSGEENAVHVIGTDHKNDKKITATDLAKYLDLSEVNHSFTIQDFCMINESSIIIKVFPERICLYDLDRHRVMKASYIPDSAKLIEFGSGILYSVSVPKVALFTNQVTNFSNEGSSNSIGRLILGVDFPWSTDPDSLNDFQLGDISIPFVESGLNHVKMKQNNKYLFFLDRGNNSSVEENSIYRVAK